MRNILKSLIPRLFKSFLKIDDYSVKSYSQEGEDLILNRIFGQTGTVKGFYVDVGAHHPERFSNTYFFYKRGWHGINIDATPGSMKLFQQIRPRDINVEAAIGREKKEKTFCIFNEPAINSFDENLVNERIRDKYCVIKEQKILTMPLREILTDNLPKGTKIDFMSIDVEGLDLEVLQSNDWDIFRPKYLLVEGYCNNINEVLNSELYKFLIEQKYEFYGKGFLTLIFEDRRGRLT